LENVAVATTVSLTSVPSAAHDPPTLHHNVGIARSERLTFTSLNLMGGIVEKVILNRLHLTSATALVVLF
jgi:hypothetical protein